MVLLADIERKGRTSMSEMFNQFLKRGVQMKDIYGFAKYPTFENWDNICDKKKESIKKIHLKEERKTFSMLDFQGIEMRYWIKEFNNRAFDLVNSYVMMMYYYNMGIPDEEWYISPGKNDESFQYCHRRGIIDP